MVCVAAMWWGVGCRVARLLLRFRFWSKRCQWSDLDPDNFASLRLFKEQQGLRFAEGLDRFLLTHLVFLFSILPQW